MGDGMRGAGSDGMRGAGSDGMRAVKIATIAMGVLILLGTTVILVTIVKRTMTGPGAPEKAFAVVLDEPAGTNIVGIASARDRLAVQLHGGGTDRVVLIDPATGAVVGRVGLAR
jgi:hypothetical protein